MFLELSQSVTSGFPILRDIEVIGYFNASLKSISSPRMKPNGCLSSFITDIALGVFFLLLMGRAICNFTIGSKNPIVPFTNLSVTKLRYFSLPILSAGATKLYFIHYPCVVIILFNTGLYVFFIYSFGELFFVFLRSLCLLPVLISMYSS